MSRHNEGAGDIELMTMPDMKMEIENNHEEIEWRYEPFFKREDMPVNKKLGFMSNFFPSYLDIFVKVELHEAHKEHQTKYVYDAGINFALDDEHKPSTRYLVKGMNLADLHMRVVLMEFSSLQKHNLIGYNKKFPLSGEHLNCGQPVYAKVPTSEDGCFTGYVFLEFDLLQEEEMLKMKVLGCQEINFEPPEVECTCFEVKVGAFILSYIFVYSLSMHLVQGPEADDESGACSGYDDFRFCLWFVLVTFTSVGYGDMYPCTDTGRLFNTLFILLNQITLAWFFSIAARLILIQSTAWSSIMEVFCQCMPGFSCMEGLIDHPRFEQKDLVLCRDSDGDVRTAMVLHVHRKYDDEEDAYDYAYTLQWKDGAPDDIFVELEEDVRQLDPLTHARLWEDLKMTLLKNTVFVFICLLFGCLFFYYQEKNEYMISNGTELTHTNTLHFAIVTMSTVGYGDWAPYTRWGRAIGAFYILLGVTVLANFAGIAIEYIMKRDELVKSEDFLNNSLVTPTQLFEFDLNGDGEITKYEYLVKSLLACEFVTPDKIDLIMTKFHDIDTDKSGIISTEDFMQYNSGKAANAPTNTGNGEISPGGRNIAVEVVPNNNRS